MIARGDAKSEPRSLTSVMQSFFRHLPRFSFRYRYRAQVRRGPSLEDNLWGSVLGVIRVESGTIKHSNCTLSAPTVVTYLTVCPVVWSGVFLPLSVPPGPSIEVCHYHIEAMAR